MLRSKVAGKLHEVKLSNLPDFEELWAFFDRIAQEPEVGEERISSLGFGYGSLSHGEIKSVNEKLKDDSEHREKKETERLEASMNYDPVYLPTLQPR